MEQQPPPPYDFIDSDNYDDKILKPDDVDVHSISSAGSQHAPNQLLHVYFDSWKGRDGKVYDSDKQTILYDFALRMRKPQMTLREPNSETTIATINRHTWSGKMDATFRDQDFPLGAGTCIRKGSDVHYDSPAFAQALTWKRKTIWVILPITLIDASGIEIATFTPVTARRKLGRLQVFRSDLSREQVDEVVFTAIAIMQDTYNHTSANAAVVATS